MNPLFIAFAGLGGYLLYEGLESDNAIQPQLPVSPGQTTSKYVPLNGETVKPLVSTVPAKANTSAVAAGAGVPKVPAFQNIFRNGSSARNTKNTLGSQQQLYDKAEKELKSKFDKLSSSAKKDGANKLNKLIKPNPGLTGKETWTQAQKKIKAALSAAGTAAGGAVCGAPCATMGAMAGAYLGDKLGAYIKNHWNDIESWAGNAADNVKDKVKNAADKVGSVLHLW